MVVLSVICLRTNQKTYDYVCEHGYENVAITRANKRFNSENYRLTFQTDFDQTYNKEIDLGYEIVGCPDYKTAPSEYCGQTGY